MNDDTDIEHEDIDTDLEEDEETSTPVSVRKDRPRAQELADETSAAARAALRNQLQSDVEAFLARGGTINEIPPNVVADPPKKPQSNYGGQPI